MTTLAVLSPTPSSLTNRVDPQPLPPGRLALSAFQPSHPAIVRRVTCTVDHVPRRRRCFRNTPPLPYRQYPSFPLPPHLPPSPPPSPSPSPLPLRHQWSPRYNDPATTLPHLLRARHAFASHLQTSTLAPRPPVDFALCHASRQGGGGILLQCAPCLPQQAHRSAPLTPVPARSYIRRTSLES
jgi:hypothetical protein